MKQILTLLIFLIFKTSGNAQDPIQESNKLIAQRNFNNGIKYFETVYNILQLDYHILNTDTTNLRGQIKKDLLKGQKNDLLLKALKNMDGIVYNYPNTDYYLRALNIKCKIHRGLSHRDSAVIAIKKFITSDIDYEIEDGRITESFKVGLLADQYEAAKYLSNIEYSSDNHMEALRYINLMENMEFKSFCGIANIEESMSVDVMKARSYHKLNNTDLATEVLMQHIFENGFASNSAAIDLLLDILLGTYPKSYLKQEYEKGFRQFTTKTINSPYVHNQYWIRFLEYDLEMKDIDRKLAKQYPKRAALEFLMNENFYKKLLAR